jgi:hypothetical protein
MSTAIELDGATALIANMTLESEQTEEECDDTDVDVSDIEQDSSEDDAPEEEEDCDDAGVVGVERDSSEYDEKTESPATNKYEHSILYKIRHKTEEIKDCYAGSTAGAFGVRKSQHKRNVCNPQSRDYMLHVYAFIRSHGGWDAWIMELIEVYPCQNRKELLRREGYWVKTLGATLNIHMPGRTKKEHYEDNKEDIAAKNKARYVVCRDRKLAVNKIWASEHRQYLNEKSLARYHANKEQILAKERERYDANKEHYAAKHTKRYVANREHILEVNKIWATENRAYCREQSKIHRDANKEQLNAKKRAQYDANKEQITAKKSEQIACECGSIVCRGALSTHKKTTKHMTLMAGLQHVTTEITITV